MVPRAPTGDMVGQQAVDEALIEVSSLPERLAPQQLGHEVAKVVPKPLIERHAKPPT